MFASRLLPSAAAGLFLLLAGTGAFAQASAATPLGMTEAVRLAATSHPTVRNAVGQALQAGEGIAAARSDYYPQVSAGLSARTGNRQLQTDGRRQVHQASLSVTQMLYDFGKVSSAVNEAEASAAAARAKLLVVIDDVVRDTAQAWIEVHRQQALGEIAQAQVKGVQSLAGLVGERQAKGATSQSDVAQAQSRLEAARAQQLNTASQAERWRLNLMHLTQGRMPVDIAGEASAPLASACAAHPQTALPAPTVQMAQAERDMAQAALRGADAQLLPTLSLNAGVNRGLESGARLAGQSGTESTLTVNFSAPLYEGGRSQARQRAALHAVEAAEAALGYAQLSVRQRLEDARVQSQGHAQRLPVLAARVHSTQRTRDLYREQYLQLGTRSLLDLLNAEQEFHGARFEQAESVHEVQRLAVECLYQSGRLREAFGLVDAGELVAGGQP